MKNKEILFNALWSLFQIETDDILDRFADHLSELDRFYSLKHYDFFNTINIIEKHYNEYNALIHLFNTEYFEYLDNSNKQYLSTKKNQLLCIYTQCKTKIKFINSEMELILNSNSVIKF